MRGTFSVHNTNQARTASWQWWSVSIFVFLSKSCLIERLITEVSVRSCVCGIANVRSLLQMSTAPPNLRAVVQNERWMEMLTCLVAQQGWRPPLKLMLTFSSKHCWVSVVPHRAASVVVDFGFNQIKPRALLLYSPSLCCSEANG